MLKASSTLALSSFLYPDFIHYCNFHFVKANWKATNFLKRKQLENKYLKSIYNTLTNLRISDFAFHIILKLVISKMFLEGSAITSTDFWYDDVTPLVLWPKM